MTENQRACAFAIAEFLSEQGFLGGSPEDYDDEELENLLGQMQGVHEIIVKYNPYDTN